KVIGSEEDSLKIAWVCTLERRFCLNSSQNSNHKQILHQLLIDSFNLEDREALYTILAYQQIENEEFEALLEFVASRMNKSLDSDFIVSAFLMNGLEFHDKIMVVGESGSGKTTLIDIVLTTLELDKMIRQMQNMHYYTDPAIKKYLAPIAGDAEVKDAYRIANWLRTNEIASEFLDRPLQTVVRLAMLAAKMTKIVPMASNEEDFARILAELTKLEKESTNSALAKKLSVNASRNLSFLSVNSARILSKIDLITLDETCEENLGSSFTPIWHAICNVQSGFFKALTMPNFLNRRVIIDGPLSEPHHEILNQFMIPGHLYREEDCLFSEEHRQVILEVTPNEKPKEEADFFLVNIHENLTNYTIWDRLVMNDNLKYKALSVFKQIKIRMMELLQFFDKYFEIFEHEFRIGAADKQFMAVASVSRTSLTENAFELLLNNIDHTMKILDRRGDKAFTKIEIDQLVLSSFAMAFGMMFNRAQKLHFSDWMRHNMSFFSDWPKETGALTDYFMEESSDIGMETKSRLEWTCLSDYDEVSVPLLRFLLSSNLGLKSLAVIGPSGSGKSFVVSHAITSWARKTAADFSPCIIRCYENMSGRSFLVRLEQHVTQLWSDQFGPCLCPLTKTYCGLHFTGQETQLEDDSSGANEKTEKQTLILVVEDLHLASTEVHLLLRQLSDPKSHGLLWSRKLNKYARIIEFKLLVTINNSNPDRYRSLLLNKRLWRNFFLVSCQASSKEFQKKLLMTQFGDSFTALIGDGFVVERFLHSTVDIVDHMLTEFDKSDQLWLRKFGNLNFLFSLLQPLSKIESISTSKEMDSQVTLHGPRTLLYSSHQDSGNQSIHQFSLLWAEQIFWHFESLLGELNNPHNQYGQKFLNLFDEAIKRNFQCQEVNMNEIVSKPYLSYYST
ncbi:hypothetical protein Ciccas_010767, partial [Cichlidogyrus casuarinus]